MPNDGATHAGVARIAGLDGPVALPSLPCLPCLPCFARLARLLSLHRLAFLAGLTISTFARTPISRADDARPSPPSPRFELVVDAQYYAPLHDDRPVRSVFLDVLIGRELVRVLGLSGYAGLTSTHAWGSIVQYGDDFQEVRLPTSVVGIGPMFLVRIHPLRIGPVSLGVDAVGSLVLYDHRFPPGGDIYNFSWRAGPSLGVDLVDRLAITAGFRWMHVSNGQGLGPQNPSYEGSGASLGVVARF